MLTKIWTVLQATECPPTSNLITLSVPDFVSAKYTGGINPKSTGGVYQERFRVAAMNAGLSHFFGDILTFASEAAFDYHSLYEDAWLTETILTVSYNGASLGMTLSIDGWDEPPRRRASELPIYGADPRLLVQGLDQYWAEVKVKIDEFVGEERVQRILMLGTLTRDAGLLRTLREVFQGKGYGQIVEKGRVGLETSEEGDVFTAARGAAKHARAGMMTDFDSCLAKEHCPKGKGEWPYASEDFVDFPDERRSKSEL
jgi:hypothetical protein